MQTMFLVSSIIRIVLIFVFALEFLSPPAHAAPPHDCASKFVGDWHFSYVPPFASWRKDKKDQDLGNMSIKVDGTAKLNTTIFNWTCDGNTFTFTGTGSNRYSSTNVLSADGKRMTGKGPGGRYPNEPHMLIRTSGAAVTPNWTTEKFAQTDAEKAQAIRLAETNIVAAEAGAKVALGENTYNNWSIVEDRYRDAARAYRFAGDSAKEKAANAKADSVKSIYSSLPDPKIKRNSPTTPKNVTTTENDKNAETCKAMRNQILRLEIAKADKDILDNLRGELKKLGCP